MMRVEMRVSGRKLPEVPGVQRAGAKLYELDIVTVGIDHVEAAVAVLHGFELLRHLHAPAGQVGAHLLGVRGFKGNMGQAIHLGIGKLGKHLDVLVVIDFEIGKQQPGAFTRGLVQAERLLEAKDSGVELAGGRQIVGPQSNVGDTHDGGAGRRRCGIGLCKRRARQKSSKEDPAGQGHAWRVHGVR